MAVTFEILQKGSADLVRVHLNILSGAREPCGGGESAAESAKDARQVKPLTYEVTDDACTGFLVQVADRRALQATLQCSLEQRALIDLFEYFVNRFLGNPRIDPEALDRLDDAALAAPLDRCFETRKSDRHAAIVEGAIPSQAFHDGLDVIGVELAADQAVPELPR
jgi:hypothetical protein